MKEVIKDWKALVKALKKIQSLFKKNGGKNSINMNKVSFKLKKDGVAEVMVDAPKKLKNKLKKS